MPNEILYVGSGNHVAAVQARSGVIIWKTELRHAFLKAGHNFVTLLVEEDVIYAHAYGYLYALDARTGRKLWENPLKGFGSGIASLATRRGSSGVGGEVAVFLEDAAKVEG